MPKKVMFNKPNMSPDVAVSGLRVLESPKGWSFKVEVEFDAKIFQAIEKDSVLLKEMNLAAQAVYDQTRDTVKNKYVVFDKLIAGMVDKGEKKQVVEANIRGLNTALEQDRSVGIKGAERAIQQVWEKWSAKNAEYKKYKIKIFATIAAATAGLITSIVLMAATPFTGGASAAFSIIGMVKSTVTLGKEIGSAWIEIETSQKALKGYLAVLKPIAARGKALAKTNEYTAAVAQQLVGVAQPNIKSAKSQLDTIVQKLTGIEVKTHDASKNLNGILDEQKKLRDEFMKDVRAKLGKHPSKDAPAQIKLIEGRLDTLLQASYTAVEAGIRKVEALFDRFKAADKTTGELAKDVVPLLALRGTDNKVWENILYFVDIPLAALSGNAFATQANDLVQGLVPVGASMAFDKISSKVLDGTLLA
jgi:hypothetical protein